MTEDTKTEEAYKSSQSKSDFIQARTYLVYLKLVSDRPVPSCRVLVKVLVIEVSHYREKSVLFWAVMATYGYGQVKLNP